MDPNPPRRTRGRARGISQSTNPRESTSQLGQPPQQNQGHWPQMQPQGPRPQMQPLGPRSQMQPLGPRSQMQPLGPRSQMQPRGPRPQMQPPGVSTHLTGQVPSRAPRSQGPKPAGSQQMQGVEQVTEGVTNISLASGSTQIPIGRGAVRGSREVKFYETEVKIPRPESSKGSSGKQGSFGQPLKLKANYYPISSYTKFSLYQYKVNFSPEEESISIKRSLLHTHQEKLGAYIFDGDVLFASQKYESDKLELVSKRKIDDQIVIITIIFTAIIEPGDYLYIQFFNILLRNCLRHLDLKLVGKNYYDPVAQIPINEYNLQLWPGYKSTMGMFDNGLLFRAEICTKVMRQETAYDFLHKCIENHREDWIEQFKAGVIGSVMLTTYNNTTYRIDDVDELSNPLSTFVKKDGSTMSYVDYYKTKWNINIKTHSQPMLVSKKKKSTVLGENRELVYLIPELCNFTGISVAMSNNTKIMKAIADKTRMVPSERINKLQNFMNRLCSSSKSMEVFQRWDLTLNKNLVEMDGRLLPPESLYHKAGSYTGGPVAEWTKFMYSVPMFTCAIPQRWIVLASLTTQSYLNTFLRSLISVAKNMSFELPQPEIIYQDDRDIRKYLAKLEILIDERNPSLFLCVLASPRLDLYRAIKRKLCVERAVPSQVVLARNVEKNNLSLITKIAIQINSKLGGAPWRVQIPRKGLMIVGFDVCHDKQNKNISYGALVASINDEHTKYYSNVTPHHKNEELSNYISTQIAIALSKYRMTNQKLPSGIIIYRDGVGDGQVSHMLKIEVEAIKRTCKEFYKDEEKPFALAVVVVKKRINTRFFANSANPSNPPPGTLVDTVVTSPDMYDFFLISQNVKVGTVTPTHYNVIEDSLNLPPDYMQRLTYKLTHMYYNWSGTVRVPAHCQLAHKLAFFTTQYLGHVPNGSLNELLYFL